jgi:hypothetical protein
MWTEDMLRDEREERYGIDQAAEPWKGRWPRRKTPVDLVEYLEDLRARVDNLWSYEEQPTTQRHEHATTLKPLRQPSLESASTNLSRDRIASSAILYVRSLFDRIVLQRDTPGRPSDEAYDNAFRRILDGEKAEEVFDLFCAEASITKPDKGTRDSFKKAMKRREEKLIRATLQEAEESND